MDNTAYEYCLVNADKYVWNVGPKCADMFSQENRTDLILPINPWLFLFLSNVALGAHL